MEIKTEGFRDTGEGSFISWCLLEPTKETDTEILDELDMDSYYSGPGGAFGHAPCVWRTSTRILVTQFCGLDI